MFDLFFWIIILAVLVPMGMRMYRRSAQRRNQGPGLPGQYPGQFPNQFPNNGDDQFGNQPGSPFGGPFSGRPDNRPRDGYTQQDYFSGGFGFPQRGGREELPPPNQPHPNQYGPGGAGAPSWQQGPVPYEDSPEYRANPPQPQQNPVPPTGSAPSTPPPPSAPQGFRARKLAELDQQYSDGQISMEEYMARRNDIMNG